jgi:hypothetical protein
MLRTMSCYDWTSQVKPELRPCDVGLGGSNLAFDNSTEKNTLLLPTLRLIIPTLQYSYLEVVGK